MEDSIYPKRIENPKTISGKILWYIEKSMHNFKHFILRNKYCMDIFFITIYLIEQAVFIYLIYSESYSPKTLIAFFVLILLSTMAIERVFMELRYYTQTRELTKSIKDYTKQYRDFIKKILK